MKKKIREDEVEWWKKRSREGGRRGVLKQDLHCTRNASSTSPHTLSDLQCGRGHSAVAGWPKGGLD